MFDETRLIALAKESRNLIVDLAHETKGAAHFGGALSSVEIVTYLYQAFLNIRKDNLTDPNRDRFILSKGHCVLSYYIALYQAGIIDRETLSLFEQDGGPLLSHPVRNLALGIESSNGSLGQGLSFAVGQQLAAKKTGRTYRNVVIMGDGECNEGAVWEAAMTAGHFRLSRLVAIIDSNGLQSDGPAIEILNIKDMLLNWTALGFRVWQIDGHDFRAIHGAFSEMDFDDGHPKLIIAETTKGKGVSFMENNNVWHHEPISDALYEQAKSELA